MLDIGLGRYRIFIACLLIRLFFSPFVFIFNCYLLTFLFVESTENNKKDKSDKFDFVYLISHFGMNEVIFYVYVFFASMHMLFFMF